MNFWKNKLVYISGAEGMLGTALVKELKKVEARIIMPSSKELNLIHQEEVDNFFEKVGYQVDCVFHLAAKVGGVKSNTQFIGDFFSENTSINNNVLKACMMNNVKRVVSVLSTCVYPDSDYVTYPLTENQLHNGPPHKSNFGYAYSKRSLDIQTRAYRQQYGCDYVSVIPNNLIGEHDRYNIEDGHVVPALIRKMFEAKLENQPTVEIWGDGSPLREFSYANDVAKILLLVGECYHDEMPLNVGSTKEYSIKHVAQLIKKYIGYNGELVFNTNKPSGQYRKPSSNKRMLDTLSWKETDYTSFETALQQSCSWFVDNYPLVRMK